MATTATTDLSFTEDTFRVAFPAMLPLIRREWPEIDVKSVRDCEGDLESCITLISQETPKTKRQVRRHLAELHEIAMRDYRSQDISKMKRTLYRIEAKTNEIAHRVRKDMIRPRHREGRVGEAKVAEDLAYGVRLLKADEHLHRPLTCLTCEDVHAHEAEETGRDLEEQAEQAAKKNGQTALEASGEIERVDLGAGHLYIDGKLYRSPPDNLEGFQSGQMVNVTFDAIDGHAWVSELERAEEDGQD